jgi:hypothetical protein
MARINEYGDDVQETAMAFIAVLPPDSNANSR